MRGSQLPWIVAPSRYLQSAAPPRWGPVSTCSRPTAEEERGRSQAELCGLGEAWPAQPEAAWRRGGRGGARSCLRDTSSNPAAAALTREQQAPLRSLSLRFLEACRMGALVATGRAAARTAMTLGCETPCKLLSAVAVEMAINDTPTLVTTDPPAPRLRPAHLEPSLLQSFNPVLGHSWGPFRPVCFLDGILYEDSVSL